MAIEYWYPNGNDGGWDDSDNTKADEGLNPGPGLDNDSSGPDDTDFLRETTEAIALELDLGAVTDIKEIVQVHVVLRQHLLPGPGVHLK